MKHSRHVFGWSVIVFCRLRRRPICLSDFKIAPGGRPGQLASGAPKDILRGRVQPGLVTSSKRLFLWLALSQKLNPTDLTPGNGLKPGKHCVFLFQPHHANMHRKGSSP